MQKCRTWMASPSRRKASSVGLPEAGPARLPLSGLLQIWNGREGVQRLSRAPGMLRMVRPAAARVPHTGSPSCIFVLMPEPTLRAKLQQPNPHTLHAASQPACKPHLRLLLPLIDGAGPLPPWLPSVVIEASRFSASPGQ